MNANTNSDKLAARSTPPPKSTSPHQSGTHRINQEALRLALADGCLTWSEIASACGTNDEQENDS